MNFSKLVGAVQKGEEIVISKAGKPIARLVPLKRVAAYRKPGAMKGRIRIEDDFDLPLPANLQSNFDGR